MLTTALQVGRIALGAALTLGFAVSTYEVVKPSGITARWLRETKERADAAEAELAQRKEMAAAQAAA